MPTANTLTRAAATSLLVAVTLLFTGCQTPDLKPFATASTAMAATIGQGGDLAIQQLAREPALVDGVLVDPTAPNHPAKALATAWEPRRRAADAIVVYSGALAAIGDASANRKANATALVTSVQQLAASIPGVSVGSSAAGNLLISAASGIVEIKAWRDLGEAVKNADPAVALIGKTIADDLAAMRILHANYHQGEITLLLASKDYRSLLQTQNALRQQQQAARSKVAGDATNIDLGKELARLDELAAGVEKNLAAPLADLARHRTALADGAAFYQAAIAGVQAWTAAHRDIVAALSTKRAPNVALLLVRAQEIQLQLQEFKASRRSAPTP